MKKLFIFFVSLSLFLSSNTFASDECEDEDFSYSQLDSFQTEITSDFENILPSEEPHLTLVDYIFIPGVMYIWVRSFEVISMFLLRKTSLSIFDLMPSSIHHPVIHLHESIFSSTGLLKNSLHNPFIANYLPEYLVTSLREEFTDRFLIQEIGMRQFLKYLLDETGYEDYVDHLALRSFRIFISAYIFAAGHNQHYFTKDRNAMNSIFLSGILYGLLQEWTGSMYYSVFTHAINNYHSGND